MIHKCPATTPACRRDGSPRNPRRTPAENWTTVRGRFPGFRVCRFRPPSRSFRRSVAYSDDRSPVTVAGAAAVLHRVPYTLHLGAALRHRRQQRLGVNRVNSLVSRQWNWRATAPLCLALGFDKCPPDTKDVPCRCRSTISPPISPPKPPKAKSHFYEWAGDHWVRAFLAPQGFHAGLHHRTGRGRQAEAGIRQARRQGDRPVGRSGREPRQMVGRHRRDAGHGAPTIP